MSGLNFENMTDAQLRLFAVRCARRVQHLMRDPRSLTALDVAERHAKGEATDAELAASRAAAWAAAEAAGWAAAWAASWDAAADAARAAASEAAWAAARDAVWAAAAAAADAARAATEAAAQDAAWAAAWDAERAEQQKILDKIREVKPCV